MIYEREHTFTQTGNMTGEKIALSFDETAHQHLMDQLTELYSDPEMACVREYTTNAHDAHVEAGQTRPIEVTTPSPLAPAALVIRDFGLGLNAQDVKDVYSKYGASTKRESNDFNGMLGFGCKAALAYTNSFTVASVKDGMRTQILCARDEDGTASMQVLYEGPSDDPNGTEISIPARRSNDFERKAREMFAHWPEGSVLLNGAPVSPAEGIRVSDEFLIVKSDGRATNHVVMGGVKYPAGFDDALSYGYSVVAYLPIGAVNIAPSREALKYTEKTQRVMNDLEDRFSQATQGFVEKSVNAEPTKPAALAKYVELAPIFNLRSSYYQRNTIGVDYRGMPIPPRIAWPGDNVIQVPATTYVLSSHDRDSYSTITNVPSSAVFTGYDLAKFTPTHKKKLNQWISKQSFRPTAYVLTDAKTVNEPWMDLSRVFQWADVAAEKLPKQARSTVTNKVSGSFDVYRDGDFKYDVLAKDFDTTKPIYYFVGRRSGAYRLTDILEDLAPNGFTLVIMGANREAKFKRDFPSARKASDVVKDAFEAWAKALSPDDRDLMIQIEHDSHRRIYVRMDASKVNDPALKRAIRLAQKDADRLLSRYRSYQHLGHYLAVPKTLDQPLSGCPLFDFSSLVRHPDACYEYLNWQYSKRAKSA